MKGPKKIVAVLTLMVLMFALVVTSACQPKSSEASAPTESGNATTDMTVVWSPDADCTVCHNSEELSRSDRAALVGNHVPPTVDEEIACIACHNDIPTLEKAHGGSAGVKVNPNTNAFLKFSGVASESCTSAGCHDSDLEERIAATADLTTFTDLNGTTVNPHDMPTGEGHKNVTCSDCHQGHKASNPASYCKGCHHDNVYECYTCHD